MIKKAVLILHLFVIGTLVLYSQTVLISSFDTTLYSVKDSITFYFAVLDKEGNPRREIDKKDFILYERDSALNDYIQIENFEIRETDKSEVPASFIFLIDNSGSMYFGTRSGSTRRDVVLSALGKALGYFPDGLDRKMVISFNSNIRVHGDFTTSNEKIAEEIDSITKPLPEDAWTELYSSLDTATILSSKQGGRTFIFLFSDGQQYSKEGSGVEVRDRALERAVDHNTVIYTIGLGNEIKNNNFDKELQHIAQSTGGININATDVESVGALYEKLLQIINSEYRVTYKAHNFPSARRVVKLQFKNAAYTEKTITIHSLFGEKLRFFNPLFLLPLLLLAVLLFLLFKKISSAGKQKPSFIGLDNDTRVIADNQSTFYIDSNDGTISTRVIENGTKIIKKDDTYVIETRNVTINNKKLNDETRILKSGDVITTKEGTRILFSDALDDEE